MTTEEIIAELERMAQEHEESARKLRESIEHLRAEGGE